MLSKAQEIKSLLDDPKMVAEAERHQEMLKELKETSGID